MFPLRLGAADAFARVVSFLKSARFDEATLCRTLGIPSMAEFGSVRPNDVDLPTVDHRHAEAARDKALTQRRVADFSPWNPDVCPLVGQQLTDLLRVEVSRT